MDYNTIKRTIIGTTAAVGLVALLNVGGTCGMVGMQKLSGTSELDAAVMSEKVSHATNIPYAIDYGLRLGHQVFYGNPDYKAVAKQGKR